MRKRFDHWTDKLEYFRPNISLIWEIDRISNARRDLADLQRQIIDAEQEIERLVRLEYSATEVADAKQKFSVSGPRVNAEAA